VAVMPRANGHHRRDAGVSPGGRRRPGKTRLAGENIARKIFKTKKKNNKFEADFFFFFKRIRSPVGGNDC